MELQFALEPLMKSQLFRAAQQKHTAEWVMGWEQANRYVIDAEDARTLFFVDETGEGALAALARNFWAFRTIRLDFTTTSGTRVMQLERPWRPFFGRGVVTAWNGEPMGILQQRFTFLRRRLDVLTPGGNELARIIGPVFRPWTFEVEQKGQRIATIRKKWSGLGREFFTDADNFGLELHAPIDARLRQLLLAATMLVDLLWFEQRKGQGGLMGLLNG